MSQVATMAASALVDLLTSEMGVAKRLFERLSGEPNLTNRYPEPAVHAAHLKHDHWEKTQVVKYPQLVVYCERIRNRQTEKFRKFSGEVDLVIEVRNSGDHMTGLEQSTLLYVEAVTDVIEDCRGEWRQCVYSTGQYEVKFDAAQPGGRRFVQTARITVPVQIRL